MPDDTLLGWLLDGKTVTAEGWEPEPAAAEMQCDADLVARVAEIARPVFGTRRTWVAGCPVVSHANGRVIAAAADAAWFVVRSDRPAGALASADDATLLDPPWQRLDPWAVDIAFAKGTDLLRAHVVRAMELAESAAWR